MKENMIDEFEIKINTEFGKNLTYKKDGELDITGDYLELTMLPVDIQLKKYEDEESGKEGELIAGIYGYYMDMDYIYDQNISLFESFDWYSGELYDLYEVLFEDGEYKEEFDVLFNPNLFYVSEIYVNEKYINEDYTTMLINKLDEILRYIAKLNVGVIATELHESKIMDNIDRIEELSEKEKQESPSELKNILINNGYVIASANNNYLVKVLN